MEDIARTMDALSPSEEEQEKNSPDVNEEKTVDVPIEIEGVRFAGGQNFTARAWVKVNIVKAREGDDAPAMVGKEGGDSATDQQVKSDEDEDWEMVEGL